MRRMTLKYEKSKVRVLKFRLSACVVETSKSLYIITVFFLKSSTVIQDLVELDTMDNFFLYIVIAQCLQKKLMKNGFLGPTFNSVIVSSYYCHH